MKHITYTLIASLFILLQGCGSTHSLHHKKQTLKNVNKLIEEHRHDKLHSALAIAVDKNNNYYMGYSYDASSDESAINIAMKHCQDRSAQASLKTSCQIYLLNNKKVRVLR